MIDALTDAAAEAALASARRRAKQYGLLAAVLVLIALLLGAYMLGRLHQADSNTEAVQKLGEEVGTERQRANDAAGTVAALKESIGKEHALHVEQQRHAAKALADRDRRIAKLKDAAKMRRDNLMEQVNTDEDCAALRRLPVCRPLADGLWGDQAADAH